MSHLIFFLKAQTKGFLEHIERLREENKRLNQRRLTEGAGFRSEIKLLRDELQRTQRQLCFLTIRKLESEWRLKTSPIVFIPLFSSSSFIALAKVNLGRVMSQYSANEIYYLAI